MLSTLKRIANTGISVNLYNVEEDRRRKRRDKNASAFIRTCVDVGDNSYSKTETVGDETFSTTVERWDKPLLKGECIVVTPEDIDFFSAHITDLTEMYFGGDKFLASEPAFAELLRSVKRRAPYDDFNAGEFDLRLTKIAERQGKHPEHVEAVNIEQFKNQLWRAAHIHTGDREAFLAEAKWLVDHNRQLIPYKIKMAFKSGSPDMDLGVLIGEMISHEARVEISDYVEETTYDPIHTMIRLVTVDSVGMVNDFVYARKDPVVRTDAAKYLIASNAQAKPKKREDLIRQVESNKERPDMKYLREGAARYVSDILEGESHRVKVSQEGGDYTLSSVDSPAHVALIVAVDKAFVKPVRRLSKDNKQIKFYDGFSFDPRTR